MFVISHQCLYRFILQGIILLVIISVKLISAKAQSPIEWTPQAKIPFYEEFTEEPPFLVADQNHTVYAFNSQSLNLEEKMSPKVIVYRQWTLKQGWADPIDIILDGNEKNVDLMDVYFDEASGIVHLALLIEQNIFHTSAYLVNAGRASAWTAPTFVGDNAQSPFTAAISGDENGNLAIIYSSVQDGNGIYAAYSSDSGQIWTDPVPILLTYDPELVAAGTELITDRFGYMHAGWNVFNQRGIGVSGHYSRLDVSERRWSEPLEIDEGGLGLGIKFVSLVEYGDDIMITYYGGKDNANWWRRSSNGGLTWSNPVRVSPRHQGTNGSLSFVIDSSNTLHAFFGQRIDDNNHGMWHTEWVGVGWVEAEPIVRGPQVVDIVGGNGFDPRSARAVIVNGNVILITWGTDGVAGENGAWYSFAVLDTAELPAIPLPMPTMTQKTTSSTLFRTTPVPKVSPSPIRPSFIAAQGDDQPFEYFQSPMIPFMTALAPVIVLLLAVVTVRQLSQ
ncbi:MAG TPA: sialidase family protein [Anaerolineae bacterium]|nr:sialidase family protein [Anaerolineae bacterium]